MSSKDSTHQIFQTLFQSNSLSSSVKKKKAPPTSDLFSTERSTKQSSFFFPTSQDVHFSECLQIVGQLLDYWSSWKRHEISTNHYVFADFEQFENSLCMLGLFYANQKKNKEVHSLYKRLIDSLRVQLSEKSGIPETILQSMFETYIEDYETSHVLLHQLLSENFSEFEQAHGPEVSSYFLSMMDPSLGSGSSHAPSKPVLKFLQSNKVKLQGTSSGKDLYQFQTTRAYLFGLFSFFQLTCVNTSLYEEELHLEHWKQMFQNIVARRQQILFFFEASEPQALKDIVSSFETKIKGFLPSFSFSSKWIESMLRVNKTPS